ncbi:MAG: PadR family transcriptional regulator [Mycobacterium leprae]
MTRLEAIVLGLLTERSRTGYELLKEISRSPSLGVSATAGSLYPALKRLTEAGHIQAEDASAGARPASSYRPTRAGTDAFDRWLREPVGFGTTAATEELLLRVLFSDRMSRDDLHVMLCTYQQAMDRQVELLEASAPDWADLPLRQRLCLENGLRSARTQLEWARWTLKELAEGGA